MRVIGYIRVSTQEQALSIEAQRKRLESEAEFRGWALRIIIDEGQSGAKRPSERPGLREALDALGTGEAQAIAVTKLDRIARSLADVSVLLDTASTEGWALIALDLGIDTSTPEGALVVGIMASIAQWERARIRERIKEALAITREQGTRLGAPLRYDDEVGALIHTLRSEGNTWTQVATALSRDGITTKGGSPLAPAAMRTILRRWGAGVLVHEADGASGGA
jgi:DNA invertase Pin-like site-specific DNA recombinase